MNEDKIKQRIKELEVEKRKDNYLNYTNLEWTQFELERLLEND